MNNSKGLLKSTILVTCFSILGIIVSFVSQLVIAYYFGTKFERDAYFIAIIIPVYIISIFTGSVGVVFLPKVVDLFEAKKNQLLNNFISSTLLITTGILILLTIIGIIFSKNILQITSNGFNQQQIEFSATLLSIVFPTIIFSILVNFLSSLYQIKHYFVRPAIASILSSSIALLFVISFSSKMGIMSLAIGSLLGSFFSFLFLIPILRSYLNRFYISFRNNEFQYLIKISSPLFLSGIIIRSTGVIERMIASGLQEGSISYLGYANQIMSILLTITVGGIATTIYPMLSKAWSNNNLELVRNSIEKFIRFSLFISIYISAITIMFGQLLIQLFLERGNFNHTSTIAVSKTLSILMGVFIFSSLGSIIPKSLYIKGKTGIAFIIGMAEIITYVLLCFYLSKYYSYLGIAASSLISSGLSICLAFTFLHLTLVQLRLKKLLFFTFKILLAVIIAVGLSYYIPKMNLNIYLNLIIPICFSAIVYIIILVYIFKIEDLLFIQNYISKFKKR